MRKYTLLLLLIITLILSACNKQKKADIITSSFFEHDIVSHVVKDTLTYETLIKPGTDNHDFEPTSKQISKIKNSSLFIFTSYELHGWLNNNAKSIAGSKTTLLNLSKSGIKLTDDLHYWTDPIIFISLINTITNEIIKIDENNRAAYLNNAADYINKITNLTNLMLEDFNDFEKKEIYFSGHSSMKYFEERFNLKIIALINDIKPDADLTSTQIISLIEEIRANEIKYLFTEELVEPKIAWTIKNELKESNYEIEILSLHSYHNVSYEEFKTNVSYYDLLEKNFSNIKKAIGS